METNISEAATVWNASATNGQVRDLSHWRGQGRWANDQAWLELGRNSFQHFVAVLRVFIPELAAQLEGWSGEEPLFPGTMLEWGPGGGSNVLALAPLFDRYYGVDISEPNLTEASRQAAGSGIDGFIPVHLEGIPANIEAHIQQPVDLFLSTAVFQHFPSKQYGVDVLETIWNVMAPGALGMVQIRYDDGREQYLPKDGDYASQYVTYTSYGLHEFRQILEDENFEVMDIRIVNPNVNYAMYAFRKPVD